MGWQSRAGAIGAELMGFSPYAAVAYAGLTGNRIGDAGAQYGADVIGGGGTLQGRFGAEMNWYNRTSGWNPLDWAMGGPQDRAQIGRIADRAGEQSSLAQSGFLGRLSNASSAAQQQAARIGMTQGDFAGQMAMIDAKIKSLSNQRTAATVSDENLKSLQNMRGEIPNQFTIDETPGADRGSLGISVHRDGRRVGGFFPSRDAAERDRQSRINQAQEEMDKRIGARRDLITAPFDDEAETLKVQKAEIEKARPRILRSMDITTAGLRASTDYLSAGQTYTAGMMDIETQRRAAIAGLKPDDSELYKRQLANINAQAGAARAGLYGQTGLGNQKTAIGIETQNAIQARQMAGDPVGAIIAQVSGQFAEGMVGFNPSEPGAMRNLMARGMQFGQGLQYAGMVR